MLLLIVFKSLSQSIPLLVLGSSVSFGSGETTEVIVASDALLAAALLLGSSGFILDSNASLFTFELGKALGKAPGNELSTAISVDKNLSLSGASFSISTILDLHNS